MSIIRLVFELIEEIDNNSFQLKDHKDHWSLEIKNQSFILPDKHIPKSTIDRVLAVNVNDIAGGRTISSGNIEIFKFQEDRISFAVKKRSKFKINQKYHLIKLKEEPNWLLIMGKK